MSDNSFTEQDYIAAKEAFARWQTHTNETVDSYILRKRKDELRALVRKVIKNELNYEEQLIVKLHWYDGLSQSQIAEKLGIDRSTVSRKLRSINEIIYDKLKYAIEYRYGKSFSSEAKLIITDGSAACACINPDEISKRLQRLRHEQCLTVEDLGTLSGIPEERIRKIEKKGSVITAIELKKLALLFRVSSDFILFGTTGQLH